jgi:hypothetical protein
MCTRSAEELGLKSFHLLTNTSKHRAMLQGMQVRVKPDTNRQQLQHKQEACFGTAATTVLVLGLLQQPQQQ